MSTYWGYSCRSHTPPLNSEMWFNHGDKALGKALDAFKAGTWPTDEWDSPLPMSHSGYSTASPLYWLHEHPNCDVGIINEYGQYLGEVNDN